MFFERSASRLVMSTSLSASSVSVVSGTSCRWNSVERAVVERVLGVAGLLEVPLGEGVAVDDQRAALGQVAQVRLQRRRVHRHEHVGRVAGREDVVVGEVELEAGDARQRAGRRADLGGEVGQRRDVVADERRLAREAPAGQLHPVAGVAGEPDRSPARAARPAWPRLHRSADDREAPGLPGGEQLVRIDLVAPAEKVPLGLVLGGAVDREALLAARARPPPRSSSSSRRSASSAAGPSA